MDWGKGLGWAVAAMVAHICVFAKPVKDDNEQCGAASSVGRCGLCGAKKGARRGLRPISLLDTPSYQSYPIPSVMTSTYLLPLPFLLFK